MNSWCFIDESWHDGANEKIGVLAAVVCSRATNELLQREMYRVRKKYFGEENARDLKSELKGKNLFSNASIAHVKEHGFSRNLAVAREIIEISKKADIRIAVGVVYGKDTPPLLSPQPKILAPPFRELCVRIRSQMKAGHLCQLVFDQRLGAQEGISIAVHNYLAGLAPPHRIFPHPLIGVSNIFAGLQFADMVAHIIARYSSGDDRFLLWYRLLSALQIEGVDHRGNPVFGLYRQQWLGGENYVPRRLRTKK